MIDLYMTAMGIIGEKPLTDELLEQVISTLRQIDPNRPDSDFIGLKKTLESNIGVRSAPGYSLHGGDQEPWVEEIKAVTKWDYWDSYVKDLKANGMSSAVIRVLDDDTNNILNECGNPKKPAPWSIKGLVMGDVQSGKTANYCGLINKAADSGYRIIILLTGVIEELRAQTQSRLDSGFVGRDSREILKNINGGNFIGSGRFRSNLKTPNVLTSVDSDFLTGNHLAIGGIPLRNLTEPVLLVLKKNKSALTNLKKFLKSQLGGAKNYLEMPMLLIDDEADNASVNAQSDEKPATINKLIRELIAIFDKSSYCAYTATPFANVFINPKKDDLFPDNFVYSLNAPNSYIGVGSIFRDDGKHSYQLQTIDDAESFFPEKHKKDFKIQGLPSSLLDAIQVFFLTCAIRDLRFEVLKHRSMLINVSRFTDVQNSLADLVKNYSYELIDQIKQYLSSRDLWSRHQPLVELYDTWQKYFPNSEFTWDELRERLYSSVVNIKVVTINQKTEETEKLNYGLTKSGRRVIAIGGLTLSRGLTLEGLSTSYFYRNSKAYDTLLQMGRWFGYRATYEDLCRVWSSPDVQEWFEHISDVIDELRFDIKRMHVNRMPPKHFGMKVRSHPGALLVTARNKMKNSSEIEVSVSFSGYKAETPFINSDPSEILKNFEVTSSFLNSLGKPSKMVGARRVWEGIDAERVESYLSSLSISSMNFAFISPSADEERPLLKFIRETDIATLHKWDICLPQGDGKIVDEFLVEDYDGSMQPIKPRGRQFSTVPSGANFYKINKQRVGDAEDEKIGLDAGDIKKAVTEWKLDPKNEGKVTVPGNAYTPYRKRPLLTINLITPISAKDSPTAVTSKAKKTSAMDPLKMNVGPYVAIGLNFPIYEDINGQSNVPYRLSRGAMARLGIFDDEDYEDED